MQNQSLFDYLSEIKPFKIIRGGNPRLSEMEQTIINDSINSTFQKYCSLNNNIITTIIYVTNKRELDRLSELLDLTGDSASKSIKSFEDDFARIALLFPNVNSVLIPKKAKRNLERYVPKQLLKAIDKDVNKAIEKCLVFLSYLSSTYYSENKWKSLNSSHLHDQLKEQNDNTFIYIRIIEALKVGTPQSGPFIQIKTNELGKESYEIGKSSKQYRLTDIYLKAGLEEYLLKDESIIQKRNKTFYKSLFEAKNNIICDNLISIYQHLDLPTIEEITEQGKRLSKAGYNTKSGKKLTMRNKHPNSYWKDSHQRSYVEDNIELFKFLTSRGFMIPVIGGKSSGGRVVDSFNLMPSWIRAMVKIDNEPIVECDFTAMHPNLSSKIYGGSGRHISHQEVAEFLRLDRDSAKKEHLSFFNKPFSPSTKTVKKGSMIQSPIFEFYKATEPQMINNIKLEKQQKGYESTAHSLFAFEVQLMIEIIQELNRKGIFVLYVYDALYCAESKKEIVLSTMNQVLLKHGVNTVAA